MTVSMRGNLMAPLLDFPHQTRASIRNPPQDEKSGFNPVLVKQIQNQMRISLQAQILGSPLLLRKKWSQVLDLKPVFEVNCDENRRRGFSSYEQ